MANATLHHFIVTRIGIGIRHENWYRSALSLFEAITFPSLCAQSGVDFTSLLIVDHDMPASAKARLWSIVRGHSNFHIVSIDLSEMHYVRQGCFDYVWDRCQEYLLGNRLIVDPFNYIITSVLDGDDAWHHDTVVLVADKVAEEMPEFLASEPRRHTWFRHSAGMLLSFPDGLEWYAQSDVVLPMRRPFNSMSVFVAARFSSGISACSSRHNGWPSYCHVLNFKTVTADTASPMWVYVRHDRTESPWDANDKSSDPNCLGALRRNFGIDFDKVDEWRKNSELRVAGVGDAAPNSHAGMWGTEQLDCYFRITALNRQIAALERHIERDGPDGAASALIEKQRTLRDDLRRIFKEQSKSMFR
jgi:hypothetical protein